MIDLATRLSKLTPAQRSFFQQKLQDSPKVAEPIAIVGMACRFPGARNLDGYWKLIRDGVDATGEVPLSRWDAEAIYDPDGDTLGKTNVRWGGFVDDVDQFDPTFFGITPREASRMDPQQRLLLEVAWESLEHAGLAADKMAGSRTGVFVGIGGTDYAKIPLRFDNYLERIDAHVGTGNALSIAANRLSYILDFRGPSFAVDTACSSGMVALHAAVMCLRNHEADAALAGGVNLILSPEVTVAFSKARMLSADGRCRPFDADANGYVRGEGCGLVMLKRLTDAVRDGDNVLAVVRGAAVNQDGRTSGITAPNSQAQQECIRAALAQAGLTTEQINYIEAHGTGTPLGDPIEFQSLTQLFRRQSAAESPCYVSSVKANIGHTETVSGIAGLIKVVLMMQHKTICPQLHYKKLNPNIHLDGSRLQIPTEPIAWKNGQLCRAGISSFGFGGTNSHIIVEEAARTQVETPKKERPQHLLSLSAKSEGGLLDLAREVAERLDADECGVGDVCYSANTGRSHFNHRLAVSASSKDELQQRLASFAEGNKGRGICQGRVKLLQRPKIAMLFTGQGSQYIGMAKQLYRSQPTFTAALDECQDILRHYLDEPLLDVLFAEDEEKPLLNETAYTQPALFAIEYSMARLWQSWGVVPDMVLGHSVGEYAAACVAGVFSLEDGLRLIAVRGQLMQQLPRVGKMAVVFAPRALVAELVAAHEDAVSIAVINGPENTVISGQAEVVDELLGQLTHRDIKSQPLTVSHAFHSPLMEPMLEEFEDIADGLDFHAPAIPLISNLTATVIEDEAPTAKYWRDHVRSAVRFSEGMEALLAENPDVILEVGPQPHLIGMARRFATSDAAWLPSLRQGQDDWDAILKSLSELYCLGADIDWRGFDQHWPRRRVQLPTYPFQRSHQWFEPDKSVAGFTAGRGESLHPLLGVQVPSALKTRLYESRLADTSPNYLKDHVVQGSVVVPGAAFLEMALSAAEQAFGAGSHVIEDFSIQQPLFLAAGASRIAQTSISPEMGGEVTVETYSCSAEAETIDWTMHACGTLRHGDIAGEMANVEICELTAENADVFTREEIYQGIAERGLAYGPTFRVLGTVHRSADAAIADVELPETTAKQLGDYHMHPALLDGMLQMMASIIPREPDGSFSPYTYMPTGVKRLRIVGALTDKMRVFARRTSPTEDIPSPDVVLGDLLLLDADGNVLLQLEGVRIQRVGRQADAAGQEDVRQWMYSIKWAHQPPASDGNEQTDRAAGTWLLLADDGARATSLAEQIREAGGRPVLVRPGEAFESANEDEYTIDPLSLENYAALLSDVVTEESPAIRGVVHLWSSDIPALRDDGGASLCAAQQLGCGSALRSVQALARHGGSKPPALWIVTEQAHGVDQDEEVSPTAASLWGLGRVAAIEHPELRCRLIDTPRGEDVAAMLLNELLAETEESQIALRHNERFVARLRRGTGAGDYGSGNGQAAGGSDNVIIPSNSPSRLRLAHAGSFDGLTVEACDRMEPPPGHVEMEVKATGLNFSDVLKALGLYPGIKDDVVPLGIECGGVVTRVGEGVDRFQVGDEVMGVAPYSFATHAITTEYALVKKPATIDFEEAATIPITFLTAYYALIRLAQLQPGERLLIHAGAGGVGLAAIQIAQQIGAEIYATAGSEQKREYLRSLGVQHVFSSRSLDFAAEILELTDREGVDVVLNSLPGEAITKSLSILRAYGRFLEIGKIDIYADRKIGLAPFQDNLSYFAIDLDRMLRQRPDYIRALFAEMMAYFDDDTYQPLPFIQFDYDEVRESFRYMAQRKNIGKVVVSISEHAETDDAEAATPAEEAPPAIREDATYLITGGLGALGLRVAEWLIERGARHVALLSRRAPNEDATATIKRLEADGARLVVLQGDAADLDSLTEAIAKIPSDFPPLRGVIHAAGVLDDGVLYDMDFEKLNRPLAPKVAGGWNLHAATADAPLDWFVLFSSVAATLGSPGQGNYAAGNAFLDGLAAYRRSQGLPATSIAWGPWAESGMAKDAGHDDQMADRGMELLNPERALVLLGQLIEAPSNSHLAVMSVRWADMLAMYRHGVPSLLSDIAADTDMDGGAGQADEVDHAMRAKLLALELDERTELLKEYFAEQLAKIMGLDAAELETEQPLNSLGLDSLMAIELKNTVEARLRVSIPMAQFMEGPSIASLSKSVAELVGESGGPSDDSVADVTETAEAMDTL